MRKKVKNFLTNTHTKKTDFFTHIHTQTIYKLKYILLIIIIEMIKKKYDVKMMIYIFFEKDET